MKTLPTIPLHPGLSGQANMAILRTKASTQMPLTNKQESNTQASPDKQAKAWEAAKEFETVFISTMLAQMTSGIKISEPFGGGHAEETWRSFLHDEYAKDMTRDGGFGISDSVYRELITTQEASQ